MVFDWLAVIFYLLGMVLLTFITLRYKSASWFGRLIPKDWSFGFAFVIAIVIPVLILLGGFGIWYSLLAMVCYIPILYVLSQWLEAFAESKTGQKMIDELRLLDKKSMAEPPKPSAPTIAEFVPLYSQYTTQRCRAWGIEPPPANLQTKIDEFVKYQYFIHFNNQQDTSHYAKFKDALDAILEPYLRSLPHDKGMFNVSLVSRINARRVTSQMITELKRVSSPVIFSERHQLEHNEYRISRAQLSQRDLEEGKRVSPETMKGTDEDVVREFWSGTRFGDLFEGQAALDLSLKHRLEHQFVLAPPGSGKTQLIQSMIVHDLESVKAGEASIIVIDSQGTISTDPKKRRLIENLINLQVFATELKGKLTYVKPSPDLAFNIFDMGQSDPSLTDQQRQRRISAARNIILTSISAGSEGQFRMLSRCVELAMLDDKPTIRTLLRILTTDEKSFPTVCGALLKKAKNADEDIYQYFRSTFFAGTQTSVKEALASRIEGLSAEPAFRDMLRKPTNDFYLIDEIEKGKVIVIDADQGLLGSHGAEAFGRFFLAQLLYASRQRESNKPLYVYMDEAADFISRDENVSFLLRQARKQDIGLIFATQELIDIQSAVVKQHLQNVAIYVDREKGMEAGHFNIHLKDATQPIPIRLQFDLMEDMPRMTKEQFAEVHRPKDKKPPPSTSTPPVTPVLDDDVR